MSNDTLYRIKVRAGMCLRPGWLRVDVLPLAPLPPGTVRLGPHVPTEIPLELVPLDLQPIGSTFWMVFDATLFEVVAVERTGNVA